MDKSQQFNLKSSLYYGLPLLVIPPAVLVVILLLNNFYFLEYFHVISGSAWTGMDLVMGLFFAFIMKGLNPLQRSEISKRLIPVMLFFMPAISTATIMAGIYTAIDLGISFYNIYFIIVAILAVVLMIQGLLIFLPNELRIFLEILRGGKNVEKIVRLTMFNLRLSLLQLIFQIVIILFMAIFAMGMAT
ncbi:MAG: hypothetical protein M1498_03260 [Candidatus Thermoplasmatota archaeon]|nr:hypothetical protein [Candidatus Thermoplasmatota archaeon]MCL5889240.1 hypothetical protein [Candidatus Thermoplasmatota archaeon]